MNLKGKKVLITQHRLVDFTGSEIITLELAEALSTWGARVAIVCANYSDPIRAEFEKLGNVTVFDSLESKDLAYYFEKNSPDYAWIHHQIIPPYLLEECLGHTKIIFNHMSAFYFQEFPIMDQVEEKLSDVIVYNSVETRRTFDDAGILKNAKAPHYLLNNAVPSLFFDNQKRTYSKELKKILIVSNHIPNELRQAIDILRQNDIGVTIAGISSAYTPEYKRIIPKDIIDADVVISIGKTVQYALVVGAPVYCYDHFGGPGYINQTNYNQAKDLNFSGRGFSRKRATTIARELTSGYRHIVDEAKKLNKKHAGEYSLNSRLEDIFTLAERSKLRKEITEKEEVIYRAYYQVLNALFMRERSADEHRRQALELTRQLQKTNESYQKLAKRLERIYRVTGLKTFKKAYRAIKGRV